MKTLTTTQVISTFGIGVVTAFTFTSLTLWGYQTIVRMRIADAIREANLEVYAQYPDEAPIVHEYLNLGEGDQHPLTKTLIVKDNWSEQLIVLPGERTKAFNYDPKTGVLTPTN